MNCLVGEQLVVRFHSDAGEEFVTKADVYTAEGLLYIYIFPTHAAGYD